MKAEADDARKAAFAKDKRSGHRRLGHARVSGAGRCANRAACRGHDKGYTFVAKQAPLRLGVPTMIAIRNRDEERHNFGLPMFEGTLTKG